MKGTDGPKASQSTPVINDPDMIAKLDSIVSNPIADPLFLSGTRSETHAFTTPSENAAYIPYNKNRIQIIPVPDVNPNPKYTPENITSPAIKAFLFPNLSDNFPAGYEVIAYIKL